MNGTPKYTMRMDVFFNLIEEEWIEEPLQITDPHLRWGFDVGPSRAILLASPKCGFHEHMMLTAYLRGFTGFRPPACRSLPVV